MAIGPSLGELTGLIQDPNAVRYADFGLNDAEVTRQKLLLQRAALGDERAKVQLQAELQRQAELGRNARANERMGLQRQKFDFEQQKFGAAEDERRRGQLEAAYGALRDAQDRGDDQGVSFASQAIERLGGTVESAVAGAAPVIPQASPEQPSPLSSLSGMPRPMARRVQPPTGAPPAPVDPNAVSLGEPGGPAGGPPPQLSPAAAWQAPEASGAVKAGLAALGGRVPPPGGPPVQPDPVQLEESAYSAPQAAGFAARGRNPRPPEQGGEGKSLLALGSMYYPKEQPAPPPPASPATEKPRTGLRVLQEGKQALSLGGPDAPNQVRGTLQSLVDNARTPEEKRSAQVAMDVALGAVQRLGVKEAIDLGLKSYEREQNNNRKTRIGTGKGVGENFGGSGLSKNDYGVRKETNAAYRHIFDKTVTSGQLAKLNQGYQALQQALAAAGSGTSTGDIMALKSVIKITDERISDADFRVMAGAGGVWSQLSTKLNQFQADADAGRIDPKYMESLRKTMEAGVSALNARRQQLAEEVANQMRAAPEFRLGSPDEEQENREYYAQAARAEMLGQSPGSPDASKRANKPSDAPSPARSSSGGVPAKYRRLF